MSTAAIHPITQPCRTDPQDCNCDDENDTTGTCSSAQQKQQQQQQQQTDYVTKSLCIIPLHSPIRQWAIRIVASDSPFEAFILAMILLNALFMACTDYRFVDEHYNPSSDLSLRNRVIEIAEYYFMAVFVVECLLQIVAHGFIGANNAYLRSSHWNKFDFAVVILSLLSMIPFIPNLSVLRSVRVLRPLRSISKLPGLRKIVESLIGSIGDLANVMLLLVFLLASSV